MKPFCGFWGLLCFRRLFSPSVPSELNHRSPSPFMERGLGGEVGGGLEDEVWGAGIKKKPKTKGFEPIPQRKPRENDLKCETQCVFNCV